MKRLLVLAFALWLTASWAKADAGCGIVFGSDWAFSFSAPARWAAQCHAEKPAGAAVALWPQGTTIADAPAVMSVTVNDKNPRSLRYSPPTTSSDFDPASRTSPSVSSLGCRSAAARPHSRFAWPTIAITN